MCYGLVDDPCPVAAGSETYMQGRASDNSNIRWTLLSGQGSITPNPSNSGDYVTYTAPLVNPVGGQVVEMVLSSTLDSSARRSFYFKVAAIKVLPTVLLFNGSNGSYPCSANCVARSGENGSLFSGVSGDATNSGATFRVLSGLAGLSDINPNYATVNFPTLPCHTGDTPNIDSGSFEVKSVADPSKVDVINVATASSRC